MGGAERVTRIAMQQAARSGKFSVVEALVLSKTTVENSDSFANGDDISLNYIDVNGRLSGLVALAIFLFRSRYSLIFSSHLHINALCSILRKVRWLSTNRLVARESTIIAERNFGGWNRIIKGLHGLYGSQDLIICQTEAMKNALDEATDGRLTQLLRVIPNPVDLEWISKRKALTPPTPLKTIPPHRSIMVWCGRLVEVKAPLLAVDVFAEVHRLGANVQLVMIGDGPLRNAVEARIRTKGLQHCVTLTGQIDAPPTVMGRAKIGLLTSRTEGFPNVVLEMLGSGVRAVVTTRCTPGLEDLPGVESHEAHIGDLAAACHRLMRLSAPDPSISVHLSTLSPPQFFGKIVEAARL